MTTIPADLENSSWTMYDLSGRTISAASSTWIFTPNKNIHDEPNVWKGTWEETKNDTIKVTRMRDATLTYIYEAHFAGHNVMVVYGDDERNQRVLIGVRP